MSGLSPDALCRMKLIASILEFQTSLNIRFDAIKKIHVAGGTVRYDPLSTSNADSTL